MQNALTSLSSKLASSINDVQADIVATQEQLLSGKKTLTPGINGVVTRLTSQASAYQIVVQNITAASNAVNVAQSGLTSISEIISQMKNLASQASSVGMSDSDRQSLNTTFANLAGQVANLGVSANFNGNNLLDPTTAASLQVSTDITGANANPTVINAIDVPAFATTLQGLNINTVADAQASITALQTQLDAVSTAQSSLSASSVALKAQSKNASALSDGLTQVVGSVQNIDSTLLQAQLQQFNNQQSIDYYLVSQMNQAAAAALTIFR